jgi:hypothetical protein
MKQFMARTLVLQALRNAVKVPPRAAKDQIKIMPPGVHVITFRTFGNRFEAVP